MSSSRKSWKKTDSRRAKLWKKVNGDYEPIPPSVKMMLIVALLIAVILLPMASYYYSTPGLGAPPSGSKPDPYTTLWNGQSNGVTGTIPVLVSSVTTVGGCTPCTVTITAVVGDYIVATYYHRDACSIDVTDSLSNTWTRAVAIPDTEAITVDYSKITTGGSDIISNSCTGVQMMNAVQYSGVVSIGTIGSASTTCNSPCALSISIGVQSGSAVSQALSWFGNFAGGCGTNDTANNGQTLTKTDCNTSNSQVRKLDAWNGGSGGTYSITGNGGYGGAAVFMATIVVELQGIASCSPDYTCNALASISANKIILAPNATYYASALSTSRIDLSSCVGKSCAFSTMWSPISSFNAGEEFAWFMTANSTLPTQTVYNPLNDTSIVLLVYEHVIDATDSNFYVYMQRQPGQALTLGGATPGNPGVSSCSFASTLFLCGTGTLLVGSNPATPVLNFTGATVNTSSTTSGRSYFCNGSGGTHICNAGGYAGIQIAFASQIANQTLYPWMNIQNSYHFGMWELKNSNSIELDAGPSGVDHFSPIISIYYPPSSTLSVNQDSSSFIGWLGRTFGGAVNTVISTIQNAGSWVQNTALGPIGNVLQGMVSWMITQMVNFLNWVGSGFGFPNLGSSLLKTFSDLVRIVTQVLINFASWVTNTGDYILNSIVFVVNIMANATLFALLTFVAGPALTLLNIILLMITLFFSFVTPASYLLMMDWVWGILLVYIIGVSGFLWWADLNVQIFTFVFKAIWALVELVWRAISILLSFVPTKGHTADPKNPTPAKGPSGGSGSGGKPEAKKEEIKKEGGKSGGFKMPSRGYGQGAKDGDPFAIVLMGFMIVVVLYWLSQAAFSPLATQTVVGCTAWSTNCHVQNGVIVGSIDTTTFFAYLFSTSHGVRIIFTLFIPLVVIMFAYWFMKNVVGEDKARGNDFLMIGGTVARTQRTGERTATSRRETMRRYRKNRGEE